MTDTMKGKPEAKNSFQNITEVNIGNILRTFIDQ